MQVTVRKNKINLSDYPYQKDIENRLLLSQLSVFEVDLLREILHHSTKISVSALAEMLDVETDALLPILDKLSTTKLFKREHLTLLINKEIRKYFEAQIEKFDEDFEPNIEFLQGLLNKVPIHVLPSWYAIPRSSDNIFASIIEKYLLTPKIYRQYLEELQFDDPLNAQIVQDLYQAPHFTLASTDLIKKYNISRTQLEECILLLEYHFVCCIRYKQVEDQWQEVITPFHEWLEYLNVESLSKPQPISQVKAIQTNVIPSEFGVIIDMENILKACSRKELSKQMLTKELNKSSDYIDALIFKLHQVDFLAEKLNLFSCNEKGALWMTKSLPEKSHILANHPLNHLRSPVDSTLHSARNFRQIEKSLRRLNAHEWVDLETFVNGFMTPLAHKESIALKNKGKRWKYAIPSYNDKEKEFIKAVIRERFLELGVVATGTYRGKECFCLTPFGRSVIQ